MGEAVLVGDVGARMVGARGSPRPTLIPPSLTPQDVDGKGWVPLVSGRFQPNCSRSPDL